MPYGVEGSSEGPKCGWRFVVPASMLASQAPLCGFTGRLAMGVFHTLSAGNIGQFGAPGNGVPAEAGVGERATVRPSHTPPAVTRATGPVIVPILPVLRRRM